MSDFNLSSWDDDPLEALPDAPVVRANRDPYTPYPPTLPHDVALVQDQEELTEILQRHGISQTDFDYISDLPAFKKELSEWKQKIISEGYSFRLKLRGIAEAYIPQLIQMLHDPTVAPSVRTDLYKSMVKWAGLEPKKEEAAADSSNKITINIAPYAAQPDAQVINITPKLDI